MEEIIDMAVEELKKKNLNQGKEIIDNIVCKDPTNKSKEEWLALGKLAIWFAGIMALRISLSLLMKKLNKD